VISSVCPTLRSPKENPQEALQRGRLSRLWLTYSNIQSDSEEWRQQTGNGVTPRGGSGRKRHEVERQQHPNDSKHSKIGGAYSTDKKKNEMLISGIDILGIINSFLL